LLDYQDTGRAWQGKSCRQIPFIARTAELNVVMIDPPFLPTTKSPILDLLNTRASQYFNLVTPDGMKE